MEPEACVHMALHHYGVHHSYSASLCAEGTDQPLRWDWWLCVWVMRQGHCQFKYRQADMEMAKHFQGAAFLKIVRWNSYFLCSLACWLSPFLSEDKSLPWAFHFHLIIGTSHEWTSSWETRHQGSFSRTSQRHNLRKVSLQGQSDGCGPPPLRLSPFSPTDSAVPAFCWARAWGPPIVHLLDGSFFPSLDCCITHVPYV